jgi:ribonuclease HII
MKFGSGTDITSAEFLDNLENLLRERGYRAVCGVDEVGRGPLAGPVVAAAVIIPPGEEIDGLDDSKRLPHHVREEIFDEIVARNFPCAVGIMDHETIDRINILQASLCAMRKAVMDLKHAPDIVLVDGIHGIPRVRQPQFTVIDGDHRCKAISAASVVAKVTRDRIMDRYEALYPSFSFSHHRGYCTPGHLLELREHGPCDIHRKTFRPVAELLNQYALF